MKKIRAFLSLNLEDSVKIKIAEIQKELQKNPEEYLVKWENQGKFHLTLRFLGDININDAENIKDELGNINWSFKILRFTSNGIGFFPNLRKPNVVFIGLDEEGENSKELIEKIDKVITGFGIQPDKRFVAHITLGRFRRENKRSVNADNLPAVEPFNVKFDSFYLMESVLDSKGSKHYPVQEFNFNKKQL